MRRLLLFLTIAGMVCCWALYVKWPRTFKGNVVIEQRFKFNDLNDVHLATAKRVGIKPLDSRKDVNGVKDRLHRISDSDAYVVDRLTHSVPYLTEETHKLLEAIGHRFQQKLKSKGLREHRIIVASVLRTGEDVNKLSKVNGNASRNSAHQYATTFDVTYIRFNRTSTKGRPVNCQQMASILGSVLYDLRASGRCHVKYERNQHCFHITACR